jgi:hypothetical protein
MKVQDFLKRWPLVWPIMILALFMAACQPADDTAGTPGFFDETPFAPALPGDPDPLATPAITPDVIGTPITLDTPVPLATPVMDTPVATAVAATPVSETPVATPLATLPAAGTPGPEAGIIRDRNVLVRASDLVGMTVVNQANERIGEVSEVLVTEDGEVRYVFFDAGGFLGIGARTTAVEWDAFDIRSERHIDLLGLDVGPPTTGVAQTPAAGTPAAGTPAATPATGTGLDRQRQIFLLDNTAVLVYHGDQQTLRAAVEVEQDVIDEQETFMWDARALGLMPVTGTQPQDQQLIALSWFTGLTGRVDLVNRQNENLGNVSDAIVNLHDAEVLYAVVDFGGFLGIGATTVLIPWAELEIDEANERFILDVDRTTLEDVPTYDWDLWEDTILDDWDREIRQWWQQRLRS